jgi:predicted helicase
MVRPASISPAHACIRNYYRELETYRGQGVTHEGALRTAFQNLLADTLPQGWSLSPEYGMKGAGGRLVRPDGAVLDRNYFPRGYWEAKDPADRLDAEIARKKEKGYPLKNTIFENTQEAILFQNRAPLPRIQLGDPAELAQLLNLFYSYTEPEVLGFEEAVTNFEQEVPHLAEGLLRKIEEAHLANNPFVQAFDGFFRLCQSSLNPNISRRAVDDMLVQHLLTERLIRTIFDLPEFTRRNAIAAEVERVIDALVSESFSRTEYLKSLDPFYVAIERAAHTIPDFKDKQHFLNTVYERFFQGYSRKTADTHGIVYTPQPIVNFMCASVAEILHAEFGAKLGDPDVVVLDPCTGTGNFIVNLMHRVSKADLRRVYESQLYANEVMLLPYYIAALNIEHAYSDLTRHWKAFDGLCFVDTLDLAQGRQIPMFTERNTERVAREQGAQITVIVGNPPYNVGQINENDNNKNRKYAAIDRRVSETYAKASFASSTSKLSDPYVKFFRWATDRLGDRDGIVCFVSNNSLLDQIAFDGFRKHLAREFTSIYHLNLQGNVRKNPKLSGTAYNVFGIQVGVGITIAVRRASAAERTISYHAVPLDWRRQKKLHWLDERGDHRAVPWTRISPDARHTWLVPEHADEFATFLPMAQKKGKGAEGLPGETIFDLYSLGVTTARDDWMYDFSRDALVEKVGRFIEFYNSEVDRWKRRKDKKVEPDQFVRNEDRNIKWSRDLKLDLEREKYAEFLPGKIRTALYRPFTCRFLFYDAICNEEPRLFTEIFPVPGAANPTICITGIAPEKPFMALASAAISDLHLVGAGCGCQCFPLHTYSPDGKQRRDNITDWALALFRSHYADAGIAKLDIFHYVYAVLHHPVYRERFADNLKRELPRIPFAPDFSAFAEAGCRLARLHLDYEQLDPYPLELVENPAEPLSYRVEDKLRLSKDRRSLKVNDSLTLHGIPEEAFGYRLGNRSALEWIVDQFQVTEDDRSGIKSDPNLWSGDERYIVRLVGQVVRLSLQTAEIVSRLPALTGQ